MAFGTGSVTGCIGVALSVVSLHGAVEAGGVGPLVAELAHDSQVVTDFLLLLANWT